MPWLRKIQTMPDLPSYQANDMECVNKLSDDRRWQADLEPLRTCYSKADECNANAVFAALHSLYI